MHRKIPLGGGVVLILCPYRDGVGRGIAFVIKNGGGSERAISIEREQRVIAFSIYELVSDRPTLRIGGIEFAHDRTDGLVLGDG